MNTMFLGLAIAVAAPAPKDSPKKENALLGEWVLESMSFAGKPINSPGETKHEFAAGGKYSLLIDGKKGKCKFSQFEVDAAADTPTVDLIEEPTPIGGGRARPGSIMRGIYKIDGERLTICFGPEIGDRPTKFESPDGSKITLMTLKRAKKKD